MNIEKDSERVRGFIQSAQSYALAEGHQQFLRVAEFVHAAQEEALHAHAEHAGDDGGQHQRGPEPGDGRQGVAVQRAKHRHEIP